MHVCGREGLAGQRVTEQLYANEWPKKSLAQGAHCWARTRRRHHATVSRHVSESRPPPSVLVSSLTLASTRRRDVQCAQQPASRFGEFARGYDMTCRHALHRHRTGGARLIPILYPRLQLAAANAPDAPASLSRRV
jgi:hypothetical protein